MIKKSIKDIFKLLDHFFKVNKNLSISGEPGLAVEIIGEAGVGKTSLVKQWCKKNDLDFVKISLSQFDDLGDFVGFPRPAYEVTKDGESKYVKEIAVDAFTKSGWMLTNNSRTENCPPAWLAGKTKPMVLLIDDWTRAQPRFQQAMMELIETQQYADNKLPEGSFVILTSNPDNGDYLVNPIDPAMRTRFGSIEITFNFEQWAEWADANGIDDRCINFWYQNQEIYDPDNQSSGSDDKVINPRSLTKFFQACGSIDDMGSAEGQAMICDLGAMYVDANVTNLFTQFISLKLDKLFTPYEVLTEDFDYITEKMRKDFLGSNGEYRADIANMMSMRIKNYVKGMTKNDGTTKLTREMVDQLGKILKLDGDKVVFPKDIILDIAKACFASSRTSFAPWTMDKELRNIILQK